MTHFAHRGRSGPILPTPQFVIELRRVGLFVAVGLVGLAVDAGTFTLGFGAGLSRPGARAASLALATLVTFSLNRRATFAASGRRIDRDLFRYGLVTLVAQGFSYGLFLCLASAIPGLSNLLALVIGAAAATALSFAGQRLFTFRATAPHRPAPDMPLP